MARPTKKGLDYFPLDVTFRGNMEFIQCEYGMLGVMVIISLYQRIYENSYYIEYTPKSSLVFSKDFGTQLEILSKQNKRSWEVFDEIVNRAVEYGIFDKNIYKKYNVLTSEEIQKTYVKAKERAKKVEFVRDYLLLTDADFLVNVTLIGINATLMGVNVYNNTTKESKVNKSKVNKSKEEEKLLDAASAAADKIIRKYENLIGLATPAVAEGIDFCLAEGMEEALIIRIMEYACEQNKRSWQYINAVLLGNLKEEIKTLAAYNRKQAERIEQTKTRLNFENKKAGAIVKKSKFNNYTDTNRHDYSNMQEEILKEMLGDDLGSG